jgi:hypothetical protein
VGWFSDEGDLARAFKAWTKLGISSPLPSSAQYRLRTVAEGKAFCLALSSPNIYARYASGRIVLFDLLAFFQRAETEEAKLYLRDRGLPILRRILTQALQERSATDAEGEWGDTHTFLIKILSMYSQPGDALLIVQAARDPRFSDQFLWDVIFEIIADGHPDAVEICERLADPLPRSEILPNYLGFTNRLCREGRISKHPFNCADGIARLSAFMSDADAEAYGLAIWAAASIPYIDPHPREALLDGAMRHADPLVRIKAAWAMAKLDMDVGRARLVEFCGDARYSKFVAVHLDELGLADLIPAEARKPDFDVMARMCQWLAHPREYGRPPDEIIQYDTRELNWPPDGGKRKRLWLFKYRYAPCGEGTGEEGVGFAGPFPFSFGSVTANLAPEDVYGLHCCDEMSSDPRVTDRRSAAVGRKLIAELNPDFPAA